MSKTQTSELPLNGEFFFSKNKQFKELIFFIHFYDGSKRNLLRHIRLVNEWGFDAFAFNLEGTHKNVFNLKMVNPHHKFGMKHMYASQIEALLNLIPQTKIVFSFSNPSASAIEAMSRRHCSDIKALVCDSGPSDEFVYSAYQLFEHQYHKGFLMRALLTPLMSLGWSLRLHKDVHEDLAKFPEGFPVLSIAGGKDPLIPPPHLEKVFKPHPQLDWTSATLPEAGHLNGLRDFKVEYTERLLPFLKKVGTSLED